MGKENGKLATLTRENHEDWFRRAKLKIREKGAWLAVKSTVEEYAWINSANHTTGAPRTNTDTGKTSSSKDSIEDLTLQFARQGGSWEVEKKKEFDQWDAKALGIMIDGLDRDDAVLVDEYETAAAVWTQLRVKYCKTDKSTARINMSAIQNFEYTEESTIDSSWTKLKEYRRKVIAANRCYAAAYILMTFFFTS
ncbi:hypothetical protein K3495_g14857 [Podosphaera aphanis]|nr:hypothetical protein K3495_g14857 [Podosphaera aphanis]